MNAKLFLAVLIALTCTGCVHQSLFNWGSYEASLYRYYKNPETRQSYKNSLQSALENGERTGRTAPGLNAELGFLYWEEGHVVQAREYFIREIELFPESSEFIKKYIGDYDESIDESDQGPVNGNR